MRSTVYCVPNSHYPVSHGTSLNRGLALPFPTNWLAGLSSPGFHGWPGQGSGGSWSACACCLSSPWQLVPQLSSCDTTVPDKCVGLVTANVCRATDRASQKAPSRRSSACGTQSSAPTLGPSLFGLAWSFQSLCTDLSNFSSLQPFWAWFGVE